MAMRDRAPVTTGWNRVTNDEARRNPNDEQNEWRSSKPKPTATFRIRRSVIRFLSFKVSSDFVISSLEFDIKTCGLNDTENRPAGTGQCSRRQVCDEAMCAARLKLATTALGVYSARSSRLLLWRGGDWALDQFRFQ